MIKISFNNNVMIFSPPWINCRATHSLHLAIALILGNFPIVRSTSPGPVAMIIRHTISKSSSSVGNDLGFKTVCSFMTDELWIWKALSLGPEAIFAKMTEIAGYQLRIGEVPSRTVV